MQLHGDADQLAGNASKNVASEQWQRNSFKLTHINAHAKTTNAKLVKQDFLIRRRKSRRCQYMPRTNPHRRTLTNTHIHHRTHTHTHTQTLTDTHTLQHLTGGAKAKANAKAKAGAKA